MKNARWSALLMCASVMLVGAPAYADCPCSGVGVEVSALNGQLVDLWDVGLSVYPYQCYAQSWATTDYTLLVSFVSSPIYDYGTLEAGVNSQYGGYYCRVVLYDEVLLIDGLTETQAAECKEALDDSCDAPDPDAWCDEPEETWCWE